MKVRTMQTVTSRTFGVMNKQMCCDKSHLVHRSMVSDFVDEVSSFVRDGSNMARLLLETNKDGYFTNDHLLDQVKKTIDIFEDIHPSCRGIFMFDNAPSHKKVAEDSLTK